jgi:DNA-binding NtrC family response regulator
MSLQVEKQLIVVTLERTADNIKKAVTVLDIDRSTMYEKSENTRFRERAAGRVR